MSLLQPPSPPRVPRARRHLARRHLALGLALTLLAALAPRLASAQGLGITLQPSDLVIVAVDPGSPGERAGLRAGDQLQALAGQAVHTGEQVQRIVASMRGPTGFVVRRGTRRLQGSITPPGGDVATRAAPAAPAAAGGGRPATAARVAPGTYRCVMFVTNQLVNAGEFTITGPGTYRGGGTNGTYTYDAASGLVRFRGASFDGQKADYERATRPRFQVYGPSGRRGALSCDGPPR